MKVMVFYRKRSEHATEVETYMRDFESQTARQLTVVDPDSIEGTDLCRIYDVVEYPTVIATSDDGQMRNMWRGLPLPTINEVSYYV